MGAAAGITAAVAAVAWTGAQTPYLPINLWSTRRQGVERRNVGTARAKQSETQ